MNLVHVAAAMLALGSPGETVLLDFSAPWCGPCRQMDPIVAQLAAQGYAIKKINIDNDRALAERHGVQGIPCFVMLVDGKEVDRVVGATDAGRLQAMFSRNGAGPAAATKSVRGQSPDEARPSERPVPFPPVDGAPRFNPSRHDEPMAEIAPRQPATNSERASRYDNLIRSSVRLRIEDRQGNSVGSGTIIDARQGEALIITCGHVFRDAADDGRISVDLFGPDAPQGLPAKLLSYDIKAEVGLLSIATDYPLVAARMAPAGYAVRKGDRVISIGCDGGADATARETHVTSINRYVGPANVQVAFQPVQGRSGGGLFTPDGLVVGVCYAADPEGNEGLFAGLPALHEELAKQDLAFIYRGEKQAERRTEVAAHTRPAGDDRLVPLDPPPSGRMPSFARNDEERISGASMTSRLSADEYAALQMLQEKARGAEVICIVRPHGNPQAKSEIIVLDPAAAGFLQEVAAAREPNAPRHLTSLEIPRETAPQQRTAANHAPQYAPPYAPPRPNPPRENPARTAAEKLQAAPAWWSDILTEK